MQGCPCCWNKRLFAWLMSQASPSYNRMVNDRKQALFSNLQGDVLEIGPGTGANFPYYPKNIRWIGIEPNLYMHTYLKEEAERNRIHNIEVRQITADQLEAADNSVDAVVSTLVLCSVPDLTATLQEILRVLKPGGQFLFIEHVAAPAETWLRRTQQFIHPVWKAIADGCNPDRETWIGLEQAGFERLDYEHFEVPVPITSPHIAGVGRK